MPHASSSQHESSAPCHELQEPHRRRLKPALRLHPFPPVLPPQPLKLLPNPSWRPLDLHEFSSKLLLRDPQSEFETFLPRGTPGLEHALMPSTSPRPEMPDL